MLVQYSRDATAVAPDPAIQRVLDAVSKSFLQETVETLSIPRHADLEPDNNRLTAHWIATQLRSYGYITAFHGELANVIAWPKQWADQPCILVGAHYDSVPGCPGADDNASAVAALLASAKALAEYTPACPVCFASFNREEDGMLGSADFVKDFVERERVAVREAHILEMVGYCDPRPGSQSLPSGLPIRVPDRGDFLGILANKGSTNLADSILQAAKTYRPGFPVLSLKVYLGMEQLAPVLLRSDHAPLWKAGIPAVMWTDTSEFRNPHYHQATDTPQTLDFDFLRATTQILIATVSTALALA